jgi:hypothetical protein
MVFTLSWGAMCRFPYVCGEGVTNKVHRPAGDRAEIPASLCKG